MDDSHDELYQEQGDILEEIIRKQEEYEKFKREIERAQHIAREHKKENVIPRIEDINEEYTSTKMKEITNKLTCETKQRYRLYRLDNYCLFLSSKYFETIDDFKN